MTDLKARIGLRMSEMITKWFTAEPLKQYSLIFLEDKLGEGMLFGELTYIHYQMFEGQDADIDQAAASVELFILASDILDDLEDGDSLSKPWMQVERPLALHTATALLTLSQQALLESVSDLSARANLASLMNKQLLLSANGQMIDLMNAAVDEDTYLEMVEQKSASLFVLACMIGVIAAGRPWHDEVAQYATSLGISAQLRNDCRDLLRWDDKSDFLNRKRTLLTMYLLEGPEEQAGWIRDYFDGRLTENEVSGKKELFMKACEESGVILYGSVISRMHYDKFAELLAEARISNEWKERLSQLLMRKFAPEQITQTTQTSFR